MNFLHTDDSAFMEQADRGCGQVDRIVTFKIDFDRKGL